MVRVAIISLLTCKFRNMTIYITFQRWRLTLHPPSGRVGLRRT